MTQTQQHASTDTDTGPDKEFADRVRVSPGSFVRFALNNRSVTARAAIVRAASGGAVDYGVLCTALRWASSSPSARSEALQLVRGLDPRISLELAGLIVNQQLDSNDIAVAGALYDAVLECFGAGAFNRIDKLTYLELLADTGDRRGFDHAFTALEPAQGDWRQALLLQANLVNPWTSRNGDAAVWTRLLEAIFADAGAEGLAVASAQLRGDLPPFDGILCAAADSVEGPLVTVLVPTHNPGRRLGTALASITSQTWRNLEVLILDDGSDHEHRSIMDAWAERDKRVRVLRMPGNIGNYAARNIGLLEAAGELVTVHDDDDWSHPRKLEIQATHLLADDDRLANMSQLVRATDDLVFTRINNNVSWIQPNYSSLMFKRRPVVDGIGYWDEVNRAADSEYRNRMLAWSGRAPEVVGTAPLSFLRVRSGSLTAGEIWRGYLDPRRRWYDLSGTAWHKACIARGQTPYLEPRPLTRPFRAPLDFHGRRAGRPELEVDVVYATDFRFPGGNTSVSVTEINLLLDAGFRVAMLQIDSPVLGQTNELREAVSAVALHPRCHVVTVLDAVSADMLVVRHPTVMQYAEPLRSRIDASSHHLIVNHAPAKRDGSGVHYSMDRCVRNFEAIFGAPPRVVPESGVIRASLTGHLDESLLADFDWPGSIVVRPRAARLAQPDRGPVLGRHSRDGAEKWPDTLAGLAAAYPTDGSRDVRILGGVDSVMRLLPDEPTGWTVHPFGSLDVEQFLQELDFWIYFHSERLIESFGMATVEAMAAGLVVILPPYMEATFGDGAVYCDPEDVQTVVDTLWGDPARYQRQSEQAMAVATERFARERFYDRIENARRG